MVKKLNVLVVEDELNIRISLKNTLKSLPYIDIVDEAKNGLEALEKFDGLQYDVLFLDIDIPNISGIEVARKISNYKSQNIQLRASPVIIFVTGYENYMLESYELYAYDYLLKPFNIDRIKHTMDRINSIYTSHINVSKVAIKLPNDIFFVDANDILFVTREGHDTVINIINQKPIITTESLEAIEQQLSGYSQFMRTHKGYIVNMLRVSYIKKVSKKVYNIYFKNNEKKIAMMTAKKKKEFELLSGIGPKKISLINRILSYRKPESSEENHLRISATSGHGFR